MAYTLGEMLEAKKEPGTKKWDGKRSRRKKLRDTFSTAYREDCKQRDMQNQLMSGMSKADRKLFRSE